jgi:hypothetical protein
MCAFTTVCTQTTESNKYAQYMCTSSVTRYSVIDISISDSHQKPKRSTVKILSALILAHVRRHTNIYLLSTLPLYVFSGFYLILSAYVMHLSYFSSVRIHLSVFLNKSVRLVRRHLYPDKFGDISTKEIGLTIHTYRLESVASEWIIIKFSDSFSVRNIMRMYNMSLHASFQNS